MSNRLPVFTLLFALGVCLECASAFAALPALDKQQSPSEILSSEKNKAQEEETENSAYTYVVGAQNLLQVKIFGEASVNQLYRVDEDGYIKHALAGRVKLGGLTVTEAEELMERKLDGDYIINPQINIFVLEFSHFSIIGEVRKPGNYEISGRVSVIRAVSIAGGFTPIANQRGVQIIRRGSDGLETKINVDATRIMHGDLSEEVYLQADDVVVVPKSFF